ncbi:Hypothetical predicted protein [Olea europaea subsp. europaea]|uniref:Myb/SANT-like domain-containing protein n=1 Tax=Olea europaea subsp. europaea TaxID=158383 RepID=A0A8S0RBW5_OLEEU|nr:Hypothetical predicted protein [Olea europaea subsp. europaea]
MRQVLLHKGWQHIAEIFNKSVEKNWTTSQMKNYWEKLQEQHKHLFELLRCTGIEYRSDTGTIVAPEYWWESKIKENLKYAKYKHMYCSEIYDIYGKQFDNIEDSTNIRTNLASIARSHRKGEISVAECVDELLLTDYVKESDVPHLFTLWFLHDKDNRNSYCAAKTTALCFKFVEYCFEQDNTAQ